VTRKDAIDSSIYTHRQERHSRKDREEGLHETGHWALEEQGEKGSGPLVEGPDVAEAVEPVDGGGS